jgi:acetolactate synthase-1/2/3 large subunit
MNERVDELANEISSFGVKSVFGVPGSGFTLDLIDKLEKKDVPFYTTHFEGSAVLMAATMGYLTKSVGVSLSIKGPGLTNAIPGISAAYFESFPLIHIAEAVDYNSPNHIAHKRINQNVLVSPISKGSTYLDESGSGFSNLANFAMTETPGPVLLQIATNYNELGNDINNLTVKNQSSINDLRAIDFISEAKKIIVIVGSLAIRKDLKYKLERLSIPIFTTVAAKGIINEFSSNSAGVYTGVGLSLTPEYTLLNEADLIVGIGLCAKEVLAVKKFPCKAINIESNETIGIDGFQFDFRFGLDMIDHIFDYLMITNEWGIEELFRINLKLNEFLDNGFMPSSIFWFLMQFFENKARFIIDTGYFCTIGEHALKVTSPSLCLMSGQGRYMGTSLPMAIGSALSDLNLVNIVVAGDGGIGMYISEIKIAVEFKLPLLIILMSDGGFGSIRSSAIRKGLTEKPLVFANPSWISVFRGFGVNSFKCSSIDLLDDILTKWNTSEGPIFIEILFPPDRYQNMIKNIR